MDKSTQYWNNVWKERDKGNYTECNGEKFEFIQEQLKSRGPYIAPLKKLEVGCGSCMHMKILGFNNSAWLENYIGIDCSQTSIEIAQRWNINAQVGNIYDFESDEKFELFLFLDVLEHLEFHNKVAEKIKQLCADKFCIIGNVPLYLSHQEDDGYERPVDVNVINNFLRMCGIGKFANIVYGIKGYPYMWFEAQN